MPTQTDVQQLIQGLTPSSVNAGNPNTVYNSPATVANSAPQPRNPAWAQNMPPIPQSTAYGQWMLPSQWQAPATTQIQLPTWNINWTPLPGTGSGSGGGGTTPPTTGVGQPPNVPGNTGGGGEPTGGGLTPENPSPDGGSYPQGIFDEFVKNTGGAGNPDYQQNASWFQSTVDRLGGARNEDGSWDWRQIVDMVSEPLVGANVWLSGSEKWDASNAIAGVIQSLTGIPVGNIMNALGQWQATQDDPVDSPLEKMLADHWEDNGNNQIKVFEELLTNYLGQAGNIATQNINNQNSNYLANWNDIFNTQYVNYVLAGMSPADANAKAKADATAQATSNAPSSGAGTGAPTGGGSGSPGDLGYGVSVGAGGCVTVDSIIETHEKAGDVKVGDKMQSINAIDFSRDDVTVSFSEAKLRPCVRITTSGGVVLECSIDAPIADDTGDQIEAQNLLGYSVPVWKDGEIEFETVLSVEEIGEKMVQHITCENNFFLAGKEKGKYLLHHNVKYVNSYGNRTSRSGWQGSGSIHNWAGLAWGW